MMQNVIPTNVQKIKLLHTLPCSGFKYIKQQQQPPTFQFIQVTCLNSEKSYQIKINPHDSSDEQKF